jgi:hypothetical protein
LGNDVLPPDTILGTESIPIQKQKHGKLYKRVGYTAEGVVRKWTNVIITVILSACMCKRHDVRDWMRPACFNP